MIRRGAPPAQRAAVARSARRSEDASAGEAEGSGVELGETSKCHVSHEFHVRVLALQSDVKEWSARCGEGAHTSLSWATRANVLISLRLLRARIEGV
jgi:cytochrome c5